MSRDRQPAPHNTHARFLVFVFIWLIKLVSKTRLWSDCHCILWRCLHSMHINTDTHTPAVRHACVLRRLLLCVLARQQAHCAACEHSCDQVAHICLYVLPARRVYWPALCVCVWLWLWVRVLEPVTMCRCMNSCCEMSIQFVVGSQLTLLATSSQGGGWQFYSLFYFV